MPNSSLSNKPRIGVSSCLLGEPVRYDGKDKRNAFICNRLSDYFEFVPICPEVSAGLGTPRPPVRLVGDPKRPQALGIEKGNTNLNITAALEAFSRSWLTKSEVISGFILKSRSPSCGLWDTPIFDSAGNLAAKGAGIFARILMEHNHLLPVENETGINDPERRGNFITRVKIYQAWQQLPAQDVTPERLARFHQQQESLLARLPQADLDKIEQLLKKADKYTISGISGYYIGQVMSALAAIILQPVST